MGVTIARRTMTTCARSGLAGPDSYNFCLTSVGSKQATKLVNCASSVSREKKRERA